MYKKGRPRKKLPRSPHLSTEIRHSREGKDREAGWGNYTKAVFRKPMEEKISGKGV